MFTKSLFVYAAAVIVGVAGAGQAEARPVPELSPSILRAERMQPEWHSEMSCGFPVRDHVGRC